MDVATATVTAVVHSGGSALGNLLVQVLPGLLDLVTLVLVWLLASAAQWVRAHVKDKRAGDLAGRMADAVSAAVKAVEQTVVADAKLIKVNGAKMSAEDYAALLASAKAAAVATAVQQLGPLGMSLMKDVLGLKSDDAAYDVIKAQVEAGVHDLRAGELQ